MRIFLLDCDVKHLVFKSFRSDLEIQESHLHANLRRIVWARKFSRNIEPEILIVIDLFFIEFHSVAASFFG